MKSGFRITHGKGFSVKFENGYTVSVQFGRYNYCDNYLLNYPDEMQAKLLEIDEYGNIECANAEVAVIDCDGNLMRLFGGEGFEVAAYYTPKQVLALLVRVGSWKNRCEARDDTQDEGSGNK